MEICVNLGARVCNMAKMMKKKHSSCEGWGKICIYSENQHHAWKQGLVLFFIFMSQIQNYYKCIHLTSYLKETNSTSRLNILYIDKAWPIEQRGPLPSQWFGLSSMVVHRTNIVSHIDLSCFSLPQCLTSQATSSLSSFPI